MRSYAGSNILIFWSVGKAIYVCHCDGHISAWCLVDLLISDHVESITEVVWSELSLLVYSSLGSVGVALLSLLSLLVGFAFDNWFVIANVEN